MSIIQKSYTSFVFIAILALKLWSGLLLIDTSHNGKEEVSQNKLTQETSYQECAVLFTSGLGNNGYNLSPDWSWDNEWTSFLQRLDWMELSEEVAFKLLQQTPRQFGIREIIFPFHFFW